MAGPQSTALEFPFRIDGTGRVMVTRDLSREIAIRLESIIGTAPVERVMRPGYGAGAGHFVFDANDDLASARLVSRVEDQINALEPAVVVESVQVHQQDYVQGLMHIAVTYRLRSTGEIKSAMVAVSPTSTYGWPA